MSKEKHETSIKALRSLLDLVSSYTHADEIRKLYECVDKLLQEEFLTFPLLVYSKKMSRQDKEKCRLHWNKNAILETYSQDELQEVLSLIEKKIQTLIHGKCIRVVILITTALALVYVIRSFIFVFGK